MGKSVTLKDIASEAGVSLGTVSYVINNDPRIKTATAVKVRSVIDNLGYIPKATPHRKGVRSIREKRRRQTNRLALISIGKLPSILRAPVYTEILAGVEETLRKNGKALIYHHFTDERDLKKLSSLVGQVDGIILFAGELTEELRREFSGYICVGLMSNSKKNLWWDNVNADNDRIGELAAECLIRKNCLNCAFIGELEGTTVMAHRGKVFKKCLEEAGVACFDFGDPVMVIDERHHYVDREKMSVLIDKVMAVRPKITGIFFPGDIITAGAYPVFHAKGIVPGRDIEVVTCNNERPLLANLHPYPNVIDIHAYGIGRRAVELFLWRIKNPNAPLEHIEIKPDLIMNS